MVFFFHRFFLAGFFSLTPPGPSWFSFFPALVLLLILLRTWIVKQRQHLKRRHWNKLRDNTYVPMYLYTIAGPKPGWERRKGYTDSNMTQHIYSDTERNTPNTRERVSREGSVSPRRVCEAMHGADESCSPPTVVAERTLLAAGLSPSGWPSRGTYRRAFP